MTSAKPEVKNTFRQSNISQRKFLLTCVLQIPTAVIPRMKSSTQDKYVPDGLGSRTGDSDRTDPNSGMGQTEQTLVTLGQTEQTQGRHCTRRKYN